MDSGRRCTQPEAVLVQRSNQLKREGMGHVNHYLMWRKLLDNVAVSRDTAHRMESAEADNACIHHCILTASCVGVYTGAHSNNLRVGPSSGSRNAHQAEP